MYRAFAILDIETATSDEATSLLEEPTAARNLVDPAKIAKDLTEKRQRQIDQCSLDPYAGHIVCVGCLTEARTWVRVCRDAREEAAALQAVAEQIRSLARHVIGFSLLRFDLPWIVTRSRLLGVSFPELDLRKYGNRDLTDLQALLTFDGNCPDGVFKRSLQNFARRFGIPVTDGSTGADVAQLVAENHWEAIAAHCQSDLELTRMLAERLSLIPVPEDVDALL